jgi:hypothetical protein
VLALSRLASGLGALRLHLRAVCPTPSLVGLVLVLSCSVADGLVPKLFRAEEAEVPQPTAHSSQDGRVATWLIVSAVHQNDTVCVALGW